MKILRAIAASPGIAKGTACVYSEKIEEDMPHYGIDKERVESEVLRLKGACDRARNAMEKMIETSEELFDKRAGEIFNAHLIILDDPVLFDKMAGLIRNRLINAEHAVRDAFEDYVNAYKKKNLHFAELSDDIIDVRNRILSSFGGASGRFECPICERQPVIVVSKRLTPSMILNIPRRNILGLVTKEGGFTTHAMIIARTYNVPVVFGVDVEADINCADRLIIDGSHGKVFVSPDDAVEKRYSRKIEKEAKRQAVCAAKREEVPRTKKGLRIRLKANISIPGEVELIKHLNYDGIGLLRTEFLFLNKDMPPSEEEQFNMYRHISEAAEGREVIIRLLDIGQDKMPAYIELPPQENAWLGIRGARALDFYHDIYLRQMKAVLRASLYGDLKILFPMVSDITDIASFKSLRSRAERLLRKEKKRFAKDIKVGVMIETPAAAILARSILKEVDFVNIGSNDLLQYTLAVPRGSPAIEERYHLLHPSVMRLIEIIVKAGKESGKEVSLCGEIASFTEYYPLLFALGLRSFSVIPSKLQDIKCELLHQEKLDRKLLRRFYMTKSKEEIDRLFEE